MADLQQRLQDWVAHPQVKAFLRVIRQGETDQTDRAYVRVNGKPDLTDLSAHPYHGVSTTRGARASGAYQFLGTTWSGIVDDCPWIQGFTPEMQNLGAVVLCYQAKAIDAILRGDLVEAIKKLRGIWVSLPGGSENNARFTLAKARQVFAEYGGVEAGAVEAPAAGEIPAEQPPAPVEERTIQPEEATVAEQDSVMGTIGNAAGAAAGVVGAFHPIGGFALGLVHSLIEAFSPLAKAKIAKELNRHTENPEIGNSIAQSLIGKAQELTKQADPLQAVAAAKQNVAMMAEIEANAVETLDKLAPYLDKINEFDKQAWQASESSMDAAAARARMDGKDMAPTLVYAALAGVGALIVLVGAIVIVQTLQKGEASTMSWAALTGLIGWATGVATMIYSYRFGTTRSSGAKDATIEQLSRVK